MGETIVFIRPLPRSSVYPPWHAVCVYSAIVVLMNYKRENSNLLGLIGHEHLHLCLLQGEIRGLIRTGRRAGAVAGWGAVVNEVRWREHVEELRCNLVSL